MVIFSDISLPIVIERFSCYNFIFLSHSAKCKAVSLLEDESLGLALWHRSCEIPIRPSYEIRFIVSAIE
jgi:hypothetical protein